MHDHLADGPDRLLLTGYPLLTECSRQLIAAGDLAAVRQIACSTAQRLTERGAAGSPHPHPTSADHPDRAEPDNGTAADCIAYWTGRYPPDDEVTAQLRALAENTTAAEANVRRQQGLRAEVLDRATELNAFSYAISHDLRAPIRHLDGFAQILLLDLIGQTDIDPQLRHSAERIRDAAGLLRDMVNGLLTFSRTSQAPVDRQPMDLARLGQDVALRLTHEATADRAGQVEFVVPDRLPVTADPKLLTLAVQQLLGNAWKFTTRVPQPRVELGMSEEHGQPVYFVRDNGAGFDVGAADRLFGAFQRLHRQEDFPGLGLGLATARRIFLKHGGTLRGTAVVDQGATFSFTLPSSLPSTLAG